MAKAYITQSKRIGSVGGETYSVVNGQTIVRAKPVSVSNPRTDAQMTQRSQFLSAIRFYQRANQNFFRFAFESKKQIESEYNAFMRLNAKVGGYITKAQGDAVGFPMIAPFILSQGSIPTPVYGVDKYLHGANTNAQLLIATTAGEGDAPTTIAGVSEAILAEYPSYRNGDIITCVTLYSSVTGEFYNDLDAEAFKTSGDNIIWNIYQFIIDTTNTALLSESGLSCAKVDGHLVLERAIGPSNVVAGCAFVVSRNTTSGLAVCTSSVALSVRAMDAYDAMRTNAHREMVLAWWGSQQSAILQGAIAQANLSNDDIKLIGSIPYLLGLQVGDSAGLTMYVRFDKEPVGITAADFVTDFPTTVKTFAPATTPGHPEGAYELHLVADSSFSPDLEFAYTVKFRGQILSVVNVYVD